MRSALNAETTSSPRRSSCDRCHRQKLRCPRRDNDPNAPCDRCLSKKALCEYSSSLPKGRPSLYRLMKSPRDGKVSGASEGVSTNALGPPVIPATGETHRLASTSATALDQNAVNAALSSQRLAPTAGAGDRVYVHSNASTRLSANIDSAESSNLMFPETIDILTDFDGSWLDAATNLSGEKSSEWAIDPTMDFRGPSDVEFPGTRERAGSTTTWVSTENTRFLEQPHDPNGETEDPESECQTEAQNNDSRGSPKPLDKSRLDLSISHLSRLSMRLSQLVRSKGFLAAARNHAAPCLQPHQAKREQLAQEVRAVVQTAFTSMSSWVARGHTNDAKALRDPGVAGGAGADDPKGASSDLPQIFASSDHLLGILRYLSDGLATSMPSPSPTLSPSASTSNISMRFENATDTPSCTIVYNLVLACASQLLNLYLTVLDGIEQNVDAMELAPSAHSSGDGKRLFEPSFEMESDARTHLQQVSLVQLCSYFIKRQNRTMSEVVLSQESPHVNSFSTEGLGCWRAIETMIELQAEVEQSLKRVQEKLCIVC